MLCCQAAAPPRAEAHWAARAGLCQCRRSRVRLCPALLGAETGASLSLVELRSLPSPGPACLYIGPPETAPLEACERLYASARASYYAGHPHVSDAMFDRLEARINAPQEKLCLTPRSGACGLPARRLCASGRAAACVRAAFTVTPGLT